MKSFVRIFHSLHLILAFAALYSAFNVEGFLTFFGSEGSSLKTFLGTLLFLASATMIISSVFNMSFELRLKSRLKEKEEEVNSLKARLYDQGSAEGEEDSQGDPHEADDEGDEAEGRD